MIVRITKHPRDPGVVYVHTPPDLAHDVMGPYQPARWSKQAGAYLLREEYLDQFRRHLARHEVLLVDERRDTKGDDVEKFTGPLPQCANPECAQPVARASVLSTSFCPACGTPWRPAEPTAVPGTALARVECLHCHRTQTGNFNRCQHCGQLMPQRSANSARPLLIETTRQKLADPVPVGQVLDEQLPFDAQEATADG